MSAGPLIRVPKLHQIRVEQDGPRIKLLLDGRLVFDAEWQQAIQLGQAIIERAAAARALDKKKRGGLSSSQ